MSKIDVFLSYLLSHYAATSKGNSHLGQAPFDVGGRFRQLHPHLRDLVKIAAIRNNLLLQHLCGFYDCVHSELDTSSKFIANNMR